MNRFILAALLPLALFACSEEEEPTDTTELTDEERADALFSRIDGFESWAQPAAWTGIQYQADGSPHGPYVQIWMNDVAADGFDAGAFADGAIFVKTLYETSEASSEIGPVLVMEKDTGYGSSDWFWAMYTDDQGTADPYGDVDMCTGCHAGGSDYSLAVTSTPGTPAM